MADEAKEELTKNQEETATNEQNAETPEKTETPEKADTPKKTEKLEEEPTETKARTESLPPEVQDTDVSIFLLFLSFLTLVFLLQVR